MRNNMGLGFIFTAKDVASAQIQRLNRNFTAFERSASKALTRTQVAMRNFTVGMGMMIAGAAGLSGAFDLAGAAGTFELEMAQVAAISNFATDSLEAQQLEVKALDAAMRTKFSPDDAAKGLQNFASQGFNAQEQANALVPALRLAQAGMIEVEESAAAMTSALKIFGIETDQAGEVTDKLLKIANLTSLQAGDLELALGKIGRGAGIAKQDLDEMLISMGLVRNTGLAAETAGQSVSAALMFMSKRAEMFEKKLGVNLTNSDGSFRDFIDIVMDTNKAMSSITDAAERTALTQKLFGPFGSSAYQAISQQINTGIKTATGELLKGAEAVQYLRNQMKGATGTAEEFEKKLLETFEGQKTLLKGVMQTLAVVVGKPFARVFEPVVTGIRLGVERVIGFINSIPEETRIFLAKIAIGFMSVVTAVGALIALRGGIMLVSAAMSYLGITTSTVFGPLRTITGLLIVAGLIFAAFRANVRDAGDEARPLINAYNKVGLFFKGLTQYFKDGELSGAILDELNKAENAGVKDFLGKVLDFGARAQKFFEGVGEGFRELIREARPAFDEFRVAMRGLGESMGFFTEDIDRATGTSMDKAKARGVEFGTTLAKVAVVFVKALTLVVKIIGAVLTVLDDLGLSMTDAIKLWIAWTVASKTASTAASLAGIKLGELAKFGVGMLAGDLRKLPGLMAGAGRAIVGFARTLAPLLGALAGPVGLVLAAAAAGAAIGALLNRFGASDALADFLGDITGLNKELAKLDELNGGRTGKRGFDGQDPFAAGRTARLAAEQGLSVEEFQQKRLAELRAEGYDAQINPETGDIELKGQRAGSKTATAAPPTATSVVAEAPAQSGAGAELDELASMIAESQKQIDQVLGQLERTANRPVAVAVKVDSETLASAVQRGDQASRARAFAPTPAEF